jgi:hypothetical protein
VHQRRLGRQRSAGIGHRRQFVVVDFDQAGCRAGDRLRVGSHRRDDLADVADLVLGERRLVLDERAHAARGIDVVAGDDGAHTRQGQRAAEFVATDAGVGMRALQDRAVQHAGALEVGDVLRPAGELLLAFELRDRRADGVRLDRGWRGDGGLAVTSGGHRCTLALRAVPPSGSEPSFGRPGGGLMRPPPVHAGRPAGRPPRHGRRR